MADQHSQVKQTKDQPTQPHPTESKNNKWSQVVSILGVLFVTLVLLVGGYSYLQYLQNQDVENNEKVESEQKIQEEKNFKILEENAKNDQIRKLNITSLGKGLDKYFKENKKYADKLEVLMPDYLRVIPLDPVTKKPYAYVPTEDLQGYTLSGDLSDNTKYTIKSE